MAPGEPTLQSRRIRNPGIVTAAIARNSNRLKAVLPARTRAAGRVLRSASAVPVSSSWTKALGRPVAAAKKRMIQRSAAWSGGRSASGRPKGPIAKDTSARAVAAKKKTATIAIRRRSSCLASFAATAQA